MINSNKAIISLSIDEAFTLSKVMSDHNKITRGDLSPVVDYFPIAAKELISSSITSILQNIAGDSKTSKDSPKESSSEQQIISRVAQLLAYNDNGNRILLPLSYDEMTLLSDSVECFHQLNKGRSNELIQKINSNNKINGESASLAICKILNSLISTKNHTPIASLTSLSKTLSRQQVTNLQPSDSYTYSKTNSKINIINRRSHTQTDSLDFHC
jgi:hypothetical protein